MALQDYWDVIKRWWWLIVASVLVSTLASAISLSQQPRIYEAVTTVIVGQSLEKPNPTYSDFSIGQELAQTYIKMVDRQPILERAADALDLDFVPWHGNVSAQIVAGTQLVEIRVRDTSPARARALANEIAQQLILQTPSGSMESDHRREFVMEQLQSLEANIELTQQEIVEEQARLDAATSARAIQQYQTNVDALQQKLASYQSNYGTLLQSTQQATNYISIIEPASLPTRPISPNVPETLLLAATIGLSLAVGGAFLIEFIDNTVKTPEDVTQVTGLPVLGSISEYELPDGQGKLITAGNPQSPITESFRALRTSIDYYGVDTPIQSLMVTSAAPSEGKSVILANLAVVMAQGGRRVVVVDADMRRPVQHELFDLVNDHGLSDAVMAPSVDLAAYNHELDPYDLVSDRTASVSSEHRGTVAKETVDVPQSADARSLALGTDDAADQGGHLLGTPQPLDRGSLHVITTGPCPPNPADLLASKRMKSLLEELEGQADIVLFDAPPAMMVTDAVVLSKLVDGVVLLADSGRTKRTAARQLADRLRQVDANILGVVLNRVSSRGQSYYAYKYYTPNDAG
jgi:non-specific protein-tyrosine kinase